MFRIVRQYVPFVFICLGLSICPFVIYMFRIVRQYVPLSVYVSAKCGPAPRRREEYK